MGTFKNRSHRVLNIFWEYELVDMFVFLLVCGFPISVLIAVHEKLDNGLGEVLVQFSVFYS